MYIPTIGLEIHAELKTRSKMFCTSKNSAGEQSPNVNICPVCMGHPGVLPTINREAVRQVLRVGVAVGAEIADYTEFDRKNYFYPDIPKAYQLSQYQFPLVSGGELAGVALTRVHLEEDTARSIHTSEAESSLVDYNRAGVPLMELVTEPVIHSAIQASTFARELQILLRTLEASHANMEKGEMRVEANISVAKEGEQLGTKVEVKNLNSFRSVERAIDFEVRRQIEALEKGEKVKQETRGWDENGQKTFSQRLKEEAADYRYFPDPDLPKLKLSEIPEFSKQSLQDSLPELPSVKRQRFSDSYGLSSEVIELYIADSALSDFFEETLKHLDVISEPKLKTLASNYIVNNLISLGTSERHVTETFAPELFAEIVILAQEGDVSSNGAVSLIEYVAKGAEVLSAREAAQELGLLQESDGAALQIVVDEVITSNPDAVSEYKSGKEQALQFLVGQGMKLSKGVANPAKLKELILASLG